MSSISTYATNLSKISENVPINLELICQHLKIEIFMIPEFYKNSKNSAFVLSTGKAYLFFIPECDPYRFREALAHEIGHLILEHHFDFQKPYRQKEKEANFFAQHLLIPKYALKESSHKNLYELSEYFEVSHEFLIQRFQ